MNGIQCTYRYDDLETINLYSPFFSSQNDNPTAYTLSLENDSVTKVDIRCGALVDSIRLETRNGHVLFSGGSGGGDSSVVSKSYQCPKS